MTAAPAAPVTRQPVPWDPWCWLEVQVATATGTTGDPDRVGYWQPDSPNAGDARYTTWLAGSVVPPAPGVVPPAGYGEWVVGNTGSKFNKNWDNISWRTVDCDLTAANFQTGGSPWDWNASPGNGTLRLVDDDHTYFPAGPGSGAFDDIGVNTPIRVIAHLTASFDENPANASKRHPHRTLITGLIRSIDHELTPAGTGTTTIHFSEPHVVYGRVNREEVPYPPGQNPATWTVQIRLEWLHSLSDDPLSKLMMRPSTGEVNWRNPDGTDFGVQPVSASGDLWTEICKASNSDGRTTVLRLYQTVTEPQTYGPPGSPQIICPWGLHPDTFEIAPYNHSINYGLDVRTVSMDCSPPDATFNYTGTVADASGNRPMGDPTRKRLAMCPVGSISFGHDDQQLANVVSIAAVNGTATELVNQPSVDRFYRHSFQRHDLIHEVADTPYHAQRILARLSQAVYNISDCDFYIDHPRDFEFAVGAAPIAQVYMDHPPVEPGRWMKLDWGFLTSDLRVTRIAHDITPAGWTVTHSYEIHNPSTASEGQSVWDDARWDRNIWE